MVGLDPNIDVARLDSLPLGSWNGDKERRDSQDQYRSEEHTSELQSRLHLVCRLLLEKKKQRLEMINGGGFSTAMRVCGSTVRAVISLIVCDEFMNKRPTNAPRTVKMSPRELRLRACA